MTPTCTARILNRAKSQNGFPRGLVLVELLVVLGIVAMITAIAMMSFAGVYGKNYFKRRAVDLLQAFQSAYDTAQQSDRRYAIILNFEEQSWMLRQFTQLDFEGIPEDQSIIKTGFFDERFQLDYVVYDDLVDTREPREGQTTAAAVFFAGHGGWMNGGKVVLRDEEGNPWSIVLYRIGKPIELLAGDISILIPQEAKNMPF